MIVALIELSNRVFEVTCTPGDEVPGVCPRTLGIRLLSGPPLSDEEWGRMKEGVVRDMIAKGHHVYRASATREDGE